MADRLPAFTFCLENPTRLAASRQAARGRNHAARHIATLSATTVGHCSPAAFTEEVRVAHKEKDSERIDVSKPNELAYWAIQLGVDEQQIRQAIAVVGNSVDQVIARLGKPDPRIKPEPKLSPAWRFALDKQRTV
jgi:Protein of unknown function (DUF3606)